MPDPTNDPAEEIARLREQLLAAERERDEYKRALYALPAGLGGGDHWIWNEGTPADIRPFDGTRVVLLGPAPYARGWNPGRRFDGMAGELTVERELTPAEVADWLGRITAANRAGAG